MMKNYNLRFRSILLHLLVLQMLFLANVVNGVTEQALDDAIFALMSGGYNLFGNAIATSDLKEQILSSSNNSSFTLFAPTDSSLYALDMGSTDVDYIQRLRYHVVSSRLTMADLQQLSPGDSYLETLMNPHRRSLLISNSRDRSTPGRIFNGGSVTVNGVEILAPDLHIGSHIVVHGLASILPVDHDDLGFLAPSAAPSVDLYPPVSSPEMPVLVMPSSPAPSPISPAASSPDTFIFPPITPTTDSITPAVSPGTDSITPVSAPATGFTGPAISPAQVPSLSENSPSPAPVPIERKHHRLHHHHQHQHREHYHRRGHRSIHDRGSGRLLWSDQLCNLQQCY